MTESLNHLASLHWAQGDQARALEYLQRAMDSREAHISLVSAGDSERAKRLLLAKYSSDQDQVISFALRHPSPQARGLALTTLLQRKGRVLDSMSDTFAVIRRELGPDEQKLLDDYRSNRNQYARQLLRGPERIPWAQHQANLERLRKRAQELERSIGARSKMFRTQTRRVTLRDVQAALPEDAILVEWTRYRPSNPRTVGDARFGQERYAASILGKTGDPIWLDLGMAEPIDNLVAAWRSALSQQMVLEITNKAARELDALIMEPVRAHLDRADRVLLAPDGPLNLIPFGALVDEHGRYLVERYLFTYLTSGRDLVRLQSHKVTVARSPALIVAAPSYALEGQESSGLFSPLTEVLPEALAVQSRFPSGVLLTGEQASESALKEVHGPAIVHIAAHGYFDPPTCGETETGATLGDPQLQSGLALTGANACQRLGDEDDGLLTALEVATLDLYGTELVVLSACDTGLGHTELSDDFMKRTIGRSDGVYGLRRALVLAGAKTQMVSLWKVDDRATRALMTAYYDQLALGVGRSQSLRKVQLAFLRDPAKAHPVFWGSFIVSGESTPMPEHSRAEATPKIRGPRGCSCELSPARVSGAIGPMRSTGIAFWLLAMAIFLARRFLHRS